MPHRLAAHDRLRDLLIDEALGVEVDVLTVGGDVRARTDQVMAQIAGGAAAKRLKT